MKANVPSLVITRFYIRRNIVQTIVIALLAALVASSSLVGFVAAYPSVESRVLLEQMFGNNVGLKILLGTPHGISTIGGFVAWRSLGVLVLVGSIWGFMLATRLFRGEEQAGRTELMLAGQTTARRQMIYTISAMAILLVIIFCAVLTFTYSANIYKNAGYSLLQVAYFSLALVESIAMFMSVGALASQLFQTRAAAMRFSALLFGIFFVFRALGAAMPEFHWLLDVSPLGWVENLQPFVAQSTGWFVPISLLIVACLGLSIVLVGNRDVGSSIVADSDTAKPNFRLLGSSMGLRIRLAKGTIIGWIVGLVTMSFIFGTVVKSAGDAFSSSKVMQNIVGRITSSQQVGENTFFGMIFMVFGLAIMLMIIGMLSTMREEEAEGYLDNIIVRPVARLRVISQHIILLLVTIMLAVSAVVIFAWFGSITQHAANSLSAVYLAIPALASSVIFVLGLGIFIYGFWPRVTSVVLYGLVIWSFLIEMVGSVLNLNHYILDTSLLHHIPLVPAVPMRWDIFWILCLSSALLALFGCWRFVNRDIALN